ncbi:hypothetical protein [Microlunatus parietis]|uniref:Uncharacterized protein n=1 Tax=Microlunatus parietis TaxID=682979 RepID=A0A7Y9I3I5_9ACTN|nr:hypothetical protein [Microlunatus parietis]NYE69588.1 hypothetical protein [Microlunatus parietis]
MITAALPRKRTAPSGFELVQETIPRPLVRTFDGIRITAPELTALDLALTDHGAAVERVRRTRLLTLDDLDDALAQTPRRRNNELRRRWLNGEVGPLVPVPVELFLGPMKLIPVDLDHDARLAKHQVRDIKHPADPDRGIANPAIDPGPSQQIMQGVRRSTSRRLDCSSRDLAATH